MNAAAERDRWAGSLLGQCLGDALGFVVEGQPPEVCGPYVRDLLRAGRAGEVGRPPFAFGQYTDDSQLARELLQSVVARGGFDPADYAARIAAIFAEGRIVGRGRATQDAALRLARGVPWQEAGAPPPNAGNGSAMRAGPVGLLFADDPAALVRVARTQGEITHQDPRCSSGAVAIAGAVALALRGSPGQAIDAGALCEQLAAWAGQVDASVADALRALPGWLRLPPDEAVEPIATAGRDFDDGWPGISPFVTGSVLWSLYAFLRSPDDPFEALCLAIEVGGDVDTTAAMTGAIAGARCGLGTLPSGLTAKLNDQGTWGREELIALAHGATTLQV